MMMAGGTKWQYTAACGGSRHSAVMLSGFTRAPTAHMARIGQPQIQAHFRSLLRDHCSGQCGCAGSDKAHSFPVPCPAALALCTASRKLSHQLAHPTGNVVASAWIMVWLWSADKQKQLTPPLNGKQWKPCKLSPRCLGLSVKAWICQRLGNLTRD